MLISLLLSNSIIRLIGRNGNNILKRLLGVLLAALAMQFIADDIKGIVKQEEFQCQGLIKRLTGISIKKDKNERIIAAIMATV